MLLIKISGPLSEAEAGLGSPRTDSMGPKDSPKSALWVWVRSVLSRPKSRVFKDQVVLD